MKKALLVLISALMIFSLVSCGEKKEEVNAMEVKEPVAAEVKNPDTFVYGTIGTVATFDPAVAYDSASGNAMQHIYEKLVYYNRGELELVGVLAEEVPTMANGGISADGKTYRFKIKKGVKFHDGSEMTPEDVEYSIERTMVVDVDGGPQWMYWLPLLNIGGSRDGDGNIENDYSVIDPTVEVDGDYVVFHLYQPFEPFLGILAGYWGGIVNKDFVIANGGWDGTGADMARVNNPPTGEETLYEVANGTGPYKLDRWVKGDEIVVTRFEDYHGKKPALAKGIYKIVAEWSTRKLMFLQGDLDYAYVEPNFYADMDSEPGVVSQKDLPSLTISGIQFNLATNDVDNPLLGSGTLDGNGVPSDFFADKNVRLAFVHAWDQETFTTDINNGFIMDPVAPFPYGLAYKNANQERLPYDLDKAAEYFKKAFGGKVWENGFTLDLAYNDGNEVRGGGCRILAENINSINPKFKVNVRAVQWAEYLDLNKNKRMPLFFIGWAPDYPDPDNYADPFMASWGYYPQKASYKNEEADKLVNLAKYSTDSEERKNAYYRLQEIYVEDAVGIANMQPLSRQYYRDWVKFDGGFFYQPVNQDVWNLLPYMSK
ncbi:MAG: ABC transporter substrate-binding protein [Spirochaetaceae bacterium]|nr:ABC transporter substrate-binding protein [Spirochaetaceae bacterium]